MRPRARKVVVSEKSFRLWATRVARRHFPFFFLPNFPQGSHHGRWLAKNLRSVCFFFFFGMNIFEATEAPKPVFNEVGTCGTIPLEVTRKCLVGLKIHQVNKNTTSTVRIILSIIRWNILTNHQTPWWITSFVKGYHVIDHLKSFKIMMNSNESARIITKHKSLLLYTIVNHHKLLLYTRMHLRSFWVMVKSLQIATYARYRNTKSQTYWYVSWCCDKNSLDLTGWNLGWLVLLTSQKSDGHQHIQLTIVNLGINYQTSYEPSSFVKGKCDQRCETLVYGVCWFLILVFREK